MIGTILRIRYELLEQQAQTPLFTVFRARDRVNNREVVVKTLGKPFCDEPEFVSALRAVVEKLQRVQYAGLERLVEVDEHDGLPFIVAEPTYGTLLSERISRLAPFSVPVAVGMAIRICDGLAALHASGLHHGDLNSSQIAVGTDGSVCLLNPCLWESYSKSKYAGGAVLDSMAPYLSPEISAGGLPSPASDVYSVGVLLYELLTGRKPFRGDSPLTYAAAHASKSIPSPRALNASIPVALDQIVIKALAKSPSDRYRSAAELLSDLRMLQDALRFGRPLGDGLAAAQTAPKPTVAPAMNAVRSRQRREPDEESAPADVPGWLRALVYAAAVVLLALVGAWIYFNVNAPRLVSMPDVVGMSVADAKTRLRALDLDLRIARSEPSERYSEGTILAVNPGAGDSVREGATVTAVVSTGSKFVELPDLRGRSLADARSLLEMLDLELDPSPTEVHSPDVPLGHVVGQVPEPRKKVERRTRVRLQVSAPRTTRPAGDENKRYVYTLHVSLPSDAPTLTVRIDMTDARGTKTVYEDRHLPGDTFTVDADGYGSEVTFRIFYDGELVKQVTQTADVAATVDEPGAEP